MTIKITIILTLLLTAVGCVDPSIAAPGENYTIVQSEDGGGRIGTAFAVGDQWLTAAHVAADKDALYLWFADGSYPAELVYLDEGLDIAILQVNRDVDNPLPLCPDVHLFEDVVHLSTTLEFRRLTKDGNVLWPKEREDGWDGKLVRSNADAKPGWSGGPMLGYDLGDRRTCLVGMTVAGDPRYSYTWAVPVRGLREALQGVRRD